MKSSKPIIGIIPDYKEGGSDHHYSTPYYVLKRDCNNMVNNFGGISLMLPYNYDAIDFYIENLDGLMIIGGAFDVNPKRYGVEEIHPETVLNETRSEFEFQLVQRALKKGNLPILGICNGMQLINVLFDGDVIQHVPDYPEFMNHEQKHIEGFTDYNNPYHEVIINKNSKLYKIVKEEVIKVNSSHHQAVKSVGNDINISANASDGIIEAIEHKTHPFCLGVQWHPEFVSTDPDIKISQSFVEACANYKKSK